ncbi:MAG: histidinol-phosphate transaminase [Pseudomonadota bacterium]|jgi:histidinol-phosphate aminotransferase
MGIAALAPEYVRAIMPYQPGKPISELAREMGLNEKDIIKLASNENPLGMSPRARQAAASALEDINRYPDGNGFELKAALCQRYGVTMDQIVLGNGSNDVLEQAARVFLTPEAAAIYSKHAFAVYPLVTQAIGAKGIETPAKDWGHDLDAMLAAITPQVRMIFIANPNNPTGTLLGQAELERFLEAVPADVVVVLDEAYNEYLPPELRGDSIAWLRRFPNLIVSRTFSKAYGLAGFRVGYAFAQPEVADLMNRVRQPFNVNSVALAAATAALQDDAFVAESYLVNKRGMERIVAGLKRLGLAHIPSHGNFVSFRVPDAAKVNLALLKQGVIVRPVGAYAMPNYLRVTIGLEYENARFLESLERALASL